MDWAVDEWAGYAIGAIPLDHLEGKPVLAPDDPALLADLAPMEEGAEPRDAQENEARDWLRQFRGTLRASVEAVPTDKLQPVGRALLEFAQSDQEWELGGGAPPPA